ncbi:DUF3054 domain-containing protein [Microbacterium amylolyticum]|uniref:DUF3054 domain-containing protein n=1 Tax=Microbacterium amylolyticum TaxID=936337 RepID=A0ABS4ZJ85_9MICO|nr:DUF3054 domain-containing protein [Microbacterium amylolyticum]MBP2437334.1 hypothetical protein [Microbacterium amylolyticum]
MTSPLRFPWPLALGIDAVLVTCFVVLGMGSHHDRWGVADLALVAWPFLVALAAAWAVPVVRRRPRGLGLPALIVALVTALGGLALRVLTGGGFALSFAIVTLVVIAAFVWGWRVIVAVAAWLRRRSASSLLQRVELLGCP